MSYYRIAYLIQPVDSIQGKTGNDRLVVFVLDLWPVDVEYYGQNEDECSVEILRTADQYGSYKLLYFLRAVTPEYKHVVTSLSI